MQRSPDSDPAPAGRSRLAIGGLLLGAIVVAVGLAELTLRSRWLPVPPRLGAALHSCYEPSFPERVVWASLPQFRIELHRPSFSAHCYANGYHWSHTSDAFGFRNPATWQRADVVLLGDSMVYGHGLEERDTLAHFLREETGLVVANQAITGGCPVHYLVYFNNFALPLQPRAVVLRFHPNDLRDLRSVRTAEEIADFANGADDSDRAMVPRDELLSSLTYATGEVPLADRLAVVQAWKTLRLPERNPRAESRRGVDGAKPSRRVLDEDEVSIRAEQWRAEIGYLRRALRIIGERARERGIEVILTLVPRADWDGAVIIDRTLRDAADELGLHFVDTNRLWLDSSGKPIASTDQHFYGELVRNGYALPGDGHPTAKANRTLAVALAGALDTLEVRGDE